MSATELVWFKSSHSSTGSGDCVEAALSWHKSSYSGGDGDDCVEVAVAAPLPHTIHIRDSKNPTGPLLTLSPIAWAEFVPYAARD
ncbi:DUF397 domain-containing protein [Streptomyces sp. NBC_00481]|uniref:DUF397 domain-containing protein n=1 Tax=unclassified Streptomyces TaxID=2593676 RepID=UPI002DDC1E40|nr:MULTISPECIES: DUF397 domain-containing protein [unclassified Streptomyces]WRY98377.1 DUF397 domain-containing protein [Streptomyces sp. NBC_00481]